MTCCEVAQSDTESCVWGHGGVTTHGVSGVAIDQREVHVDHTVRRSATGGCGCDPSAVTAGSRANPGGVSGDRERLRAARVGRLRSHAVRVVRPHFPGRCARGSHGATDHPPRALFADGPPTHRGAWPGDGVGAPFPHPVLWLPPAGPGGREEAREVDPRDWGSGVRGRTGHDACRFDGALRFLRPRRARLWRRARHPRNLPCDMAENDARGVPARYFRASPTAFTHARSSPVAASTIR